MSDIHTDLVFRHDVDLMNFASRELFLNGRSFGAKGYAFPRLGMQGRYGKYPERARVIRTTGDLHLSWDIPYEPGTLKAVGAKHGAVAASVEVSTAGEPSAIGLSADREIVVNRGDGIVHVTAQILDDRSRLVPIAGNVVSFSVEGDGVLIGVDSGDPASHEDYHSASRRAFNGLCLAIVRSTGKDGYIRVTAASPLLRTASVTIAAKA